MATEFEKRECGIQCGTEVRGSYNRDEEHKKWRLEDLLRRLHDKKTLIDWLIEEELIAKMQVCQCCGSEMKLINCNNRSDGYKQQNPRGSTKVHILVVSAPSCDHFGCHGE